MPMLLRFASFAYFSRFYPRQLVRKQGNCYAVFKSKFRGHLTEPFIETPRGRVLTFYDLEVISGHFVAFFENLGMKLGDRVLVQVQKSPEAVCLYVACLRAGVVYVPLGEGLQEQEVLSIANQAQPSLFVCSPEKIELYGEWAKANSVPIRTLGTPRDGSLVEEAQRMGLDLRVRNVPASTPACILYTSGTTGRPKGAVITHENIVENTTDTRDAWGIERDDILLHVLSIAHIAGLVDLNLVLLTASRAILCGATPSLVTTELLPHATWVRASPDWYARLFEDERIDCRIAFGSLRIALTASAPVNADFFRLFKARTGKSLIHRYGMTEAGVIATGPLNHERAGSPGKPLPSAEVRIVDERGGVVPPEIVGSIEVRGGGVFAGYWNDPERTAEAFTPDGFFRTGDIGRFDKDGYLWIEGRTKDVIIRGGAKVYPKEVEICIDALDGVRESAVFGIADPMLGECPVAVIVSESGELDQPELFVKESLKPLLAPYKIPVRVWQISEMPRTETGKIKKETLRAQFESATLSE